MKIDLNVRGENESRADVVPGRGQALRSATARSLLPPSRRSIRTGPQSLAASLFVFDYRDTVQRHRLDSARLRSRVAAPKVWVPPANLPRASDGLPRSSVDGARRDSRSRGTRPTSRAAGAGRVDRGEQLVGVRPRSPSEEVRRRRTATHELDVHVPSSRRGRSGGADRSGRRRRAAGPLELHPCAWRRQPLELARRAHARSTRPLRAPGASIWTSRTRCRLASSSVSPSPTRLTTALALAPPLDDDAQPASATPRSRDGAGSGQTGGSSSMPARFALSLRSTYRRPEEARRKRRPRPQPCRL